MKRRAKADGGLTSAVLEYLATQDDVWAERRNSGSVMWPSPRGKLYNIWLGEPGTPDICALLFKPRARALYFGIETKALKGKARVTQLEWRELAKRWGVPVLETRSLHDVVDFVAYLRGVP